CRSPTPTRTSRKRSIYSTRRSRSSPPAREVAEDSMNLSRRHLLKLGGAALAGASMAPAVARAQTPKRGGTLAIRTWDPPHFDPFQTISYKTHIALSFTHSRLLKHNANAYMLKAVNKVEAPDKYTVKFTLKEPFVWFLDMISNPHAVAIVAKEVLDKHGDFKKWESVIGTGPWMLDSYRPNVGLSYV